MTGERSPSLSHCVLTLYWYFGWILCREHIIFQIRKVIKMFICSMCLWCHIQAVVFGYNKLCLTISMAHFELFWNWHTLASQSRMKCSFSYDWLRFYSLMFGWLANNTSVFDVTEECRFIFAGLRLEPKSKHSTVDVEIHCRGDCGVPNCRQDRG